jgi:O-antigen/teichoic acid export membrane protein
MTAHAPPVADQGWRHESGARRLLVGGGAWGLADFALSMVLGLPLTIVLVRVLPRHVYGSVATAMSIALLIGSVVAVGLADSVARTLAWDDGSRESGARPDGAADVLATAWRLAALGAGLGAVLAVAVAVPLTQSRDSGAASLVIIAVPMVMVYPVHSVLIGVVRVSFRPALMFLSSIIASGLALIGTVLVLVLGARVGPPIVAVRVAASLVGVLILFLSLRPRLPADGTASRDTARSMLRIGGAVMVVSLAAAAISQLDVVAVGIFRGEVAAGFYAPLSRLLDLVIGAFAALGAYAIVALSSAASRSTSSLARQYHWCTRWTLVALGPPVAVLLVVPAPVLHLLFGAEPPDASLVVRIIAAAACVHISLGYNGLCLVALGQSRLVLLQGVAALAVSIAACLVLVPAYGLPGAAASTAFALVASNLVSSVSLWRRHAVRPLDRAAALTAVGFALALAVSIGLAQLLGTRLLTAAVVLVLVTAVTSAVAFRQSGGRSGQEWLALRALAAGLRHAHPPAPARPVDMAR